jgi:hypothetical protein
MIEMTRDMERVAGTTAGTTTATKDEDGLEDATIAASWNGQATKSPPGLATTTTPATGVNTPMAAAITAKETGTKSVAGSAGATAIAEKAAIGLADATATNSAASDRETG